MKVRIHNRVIGKRYRGALINFVIMTKIEEKMTRHQGQNDENSIFGCVMLQVRECHMVETKVKTSIWY